jgi:Zn-dependent peptidase ImmA (M78 family)
MRPRTNTRIEERAQQVLEAADALQRPVPLENVARYLDLEVEEAFLGDDVSGILVVEHGKGRIGFNINHSSVRQRFSIAHEIAHFVLHQTKAPLFIDKNYTVYHRDERSSSGENLQEIQANQFAAALLMPEGLVREALAELDFDLGDEDGTALEDLAKQFQVSRQAMSFRLANLGLLNG